MVRVALEVHALVAAQGLEVGAVGRVRGGLGRILDDDVAAAGSEDGGEERKDWKARAGELHAIMVHQAAAR